MHASKRDERRLESVPPLDVAHLSRGALVTTQVSSLTSLQTPVRVASDAVPWSLLERPSPPRLLISRPLAPTLADPGCPIADPYAFPKALSHSSESRRPASPSSPSSSPSLPASQAMADQLYLRYYSGHVGSYGHEFIEFEISGNRLRFALNTKCPFSPGPRSPTPRTDTPRPAQLPQRGPHPARECVHRLSLSPDPADPDPDPDSLSSTVHLSQAVLDEFKRIVAESEIVKCVQFPLSLSPSPLPLPLALPLTRSPRSSPRPALPRHAGRTTPTGPRRTSSAGKNSRSCSRLTTSRSRCAPRPTSHSTVVESRCGPSLTLARPPVDGQDRFARRRAELG